MEQENNVKNWMHSNRFAIVGVVAILGFMVQGYFMYLTMSKDRPRNLIVMEKSPVRVILRWDTAENELDNHDALKEYIGERVKIYSYLKEIPFVDYKFNENLYVRINTLDMKTDDADIKLDERSSITESESTDTEINEDDKSK